MKELKIETTTKIDTKVTLDGLDIDYVLDEAADNWAWQNTWLEDNHAASVNEHNCATESFKAGANWQKENKETIELAEDHALLAGRMQMREEMLKDAIEATVYEDAGGYPFIPAIEMYDYDKDEPTAKKGDKVKVYIFKEQ